MGLVRYLRGALAASVWLTAMATMSGCPTRDVGLALLVSPQPLEFGTSRNEIALTIKTNFSTTRPEPLTLKSNAAWIIVGNCTDAAEGCLVGSITESITIPIRIDRAKTNLGANRATILVDMPGASQVALEVRAQDLLKPEFSISNRRVGVGESVVFVNSSSAAPEAGDITRYHWDFGDGNTSSQAAPVHVYGMPGVYTVSLTIFTRNGGTETIMRENYVVAGNPEPVADFSAAPRELFVGESVQFTDLTTSNAGPILSRQWDFGDGGMSSQINPTHQYTKSGLRTVTLTVNTEFASDSETKTAYVLVKRKSAPEAAIGVSTVNPAVGDVIQFNDASIPGTAPIRQWVWQFGDGTVSTRQNPTHTFQRADTFNVRLTVTSDHGSSTATVPLTLTFAPPRADFDVLNTNPSTCSSAACPEAVQFIDRSAPGSGQIRQWLWDFGDGNTSNDQNPRHGYANVGTYSVTLTVVSTAPLNNTASITKRNLIVAVNPPRPDFLIGTRSAFTNTTVQFTNRTRIGTESPVTYQWDFDGNPSTISDTSALENPSYQYPQAGRYNPTLTAITATRSEKASREIIVDGVTTANFSATPRIATTATTVQFRDTSTLGARGAGGAPAVEAYRWDFGDGNISTEANPSHRYAAPGAYTVRLTITYSHSGSGVQFTSTKSETGFVTVNLPDPPVANFSVLNPDCLFVGDTMNVSAVTSPQIDTYLWDFGDPASVGQNTANTPNASHLYSAPGVYTVTLTVTDNDIEPPRNTATKTMQVVVADLTDLDLYVREADPRFTFSQAGQPFNLTIGLLNAGTAYNLYMNSGLWRDANDINQSSYDGISWKHNVTIVDPQNRRHDTAVLLINGGSRFDSAPTAADLLSFGAPEIGLATGAPLVIVDDVPAQPIQFRNDTVNERTEDALIAYSFSRYLQDFENVNQPLYPDAQYPWPAVHVMARAAVRAMDAAQDFMISRNRPIEDFIVTGASKRGWTTWLTGISDCRVKAIAPIVFDVLNMDESMIHHRNSLRTQNFGTTGGYSDAVVDYTRLGIFDRLSAVNDPAGESLLSLVDPFEYRQRMIMPKLLINASGDEFFLADSAQFYIDDLSGESNITYIPNVGHGLGNNPFDIGNTNSALYILTSWILGVLQDVPRPNINWAFPDDNTIVVTLDDPSTAGTPEVRLWSINNPLHRDFRNPITTALGRSWTSTTLTARPDGSFAGSVNTPDQGWTAYYIQVRFDNDATLAINLPGVPVPQFVFSTPIRVVPDVYP